VPGSLLVFSHRWRYFLDGVSKGVSNWYGRFINPEASDFYSDLESGGFAADSLIDVLPEHRLIYICVPKCASTTIKMALSRLGGRSPASSAQLHKRRYSGLNSPVRAGLTTFHRLATSPGTLRFSFVRNPYARLVSAWADKFQNKPLIPGDSFIDQYLTHRSAIDPLLPEGSDCTLSFDQFARFACATADRRVDPHWHLQSDLISMPGVTLDFVGKVESFDKDFTRVLDHVGADDQLRRASDIRLNPSQHRPWQSYYSGDLADAVYRAYERDFDRFDYLRPIPTAKCNRTAV
jgi:Sulfotransferase family